MSLSSIKWEAGLTGLQEMNIIASGLNVLLHVFGSGAIFALALPLLVLWPYMRDVSCIIIAACEPYLITGLAHTSL